MVEGRRAEMQDQAHGLRFPVAYQGGQVMMWIIIVGSISGLGLAYGLVLLKDWMDGNG